MKDKRRKFFQDLACDWDTLFHCKGKQLEQRLDKLLVDFKIAKGGKTLDLGCGTGIISAKLSKLAGEKGEVIGCDFCFPMLKIAKKKAKALSFLCADAHRLAFKNGFFKNVVCFSCFPHFADKQRVLEEANRILKKGGHLIISHLLSSRQIAHLHSRVKGAVGHDRLPSKKRMLANLKKAGFRPIQFVDQDGLYLLQAEKIC